MKRSFKTASAGAQRKRIKIRSARTIASESASASIKNGVLPIQEFMASRKFEIKALVDAMQKSREAGVQRAFQSLPRYLRRRAASHNVKRVPRRLRGRARAEMTAENAPTLHKRLPFKRKRGRQATLCKIAKLQAKKGQREPFEPDLIPDTELPAVKPIPQSKYVKRQKNKTWLPSHLWTCKRAKMITKWGYACPVSPNEKTYRSTHRASTTKGAIVFDTSYTGSILFQGSAVEIAAILEKITRAKNAFGLRARRGQRTIDVHCFDGDELICPATVLWSTVSDEISSALLRVHPASYVAIWKLVLTLCKALHFESLKIMDMRFHIGSIELLGPLAINCLLSVLKCGGEQTESSRAFRSLHSTNPSELPDNVVLHLSVQDSRLNFPPRQVTEPAKANNPFLYSWPLPTETSSLFSYSQTQQSNTGKPNTSDLKDGNTPLVPVTVVRTKLGIGLLAPWAYITDFWYALNHLPLVRFGGLQELAQIYYEHQTPFFPNDYPGTKAGQDLMQEQRDREEAIYLRKPPAKRVSFNKVINGKCEVGDPFACDFEALINGGGLHESVSQSTQDISHVSASITEPSFDPQSVQVQMTTTSNLRIVNGDVTEDITMEDVTPMYSSTPLLSVPATTTTTSSTSKPKPSSIPKASSIAGPAHSAQAAVSPTSVPALPAQPKLVLPCHLASLTMLQAKCSIVQVTFTLLQRGCPQSRARIYEYRTTSDTEHEDEQGRDEYKGYGIEGDTELRRIRGSPGLLIGFVTTGNFNLAMGRATCIGSLTARHVTTSLAAVTMDTASAVAGLAMRNDKKTDSRTNGSRNTTKGALKDIQVSRHHALCFVRDSGSPHYRLAKWQLVKEA